MLPPQVRHSRVTTLAVVQGSCVRGQSDYSLCLRVQRSRSSRQHGQDAEATDAGGKRRGLHHTVRVQIPAPDHDLLSVHLVRDEHDLLRADAEHERVRDQRLFDFSE